MTRDSALWYSDGNVVVGSGSTLFRVHKSVLSKHSEVFDGMFSGPPHTGEEVDGCPFVRLFGDHPSEVRCMLKDMYGLRDRTSRKVTLEVLCVLVRLGEKYDIPAMRAEGDNILRELYDVSLEVFQERNQAVSLFGGSLYCGTPDPNARADFPIAPWKRQHCFDIYVLARDHVMNTIAARALYGCCRWPLADLKLELTTLLTPDVLWACALGREILAKRGGVQLLKLNPAHLKTIPMPMGLFSASAPCEKQDVCGPALEKTFKIVRLGLAPPRQYPVGEDDRYALIQRLKQELCGSCQARVTRAIQDDARVVWNSLPDLLASAMAGAPA
ncbi:unnamed protein product [Peniophora sp. CBMAI 1063]|nr:unnamed protein product [Peniophora sp. CBMAI 1063]